MLVGPWAKLYFLKESVKQNNFERLKGSMVNVTNLHGHGLSVKFHYQLIAILSSQGIIGNNPRWRPISHQVNHRLQKSNKIGQG